MTWVRRLFIGMGLALCASAGAMAAQAVLGISILDSTVDKVLYPAAALFVGLAFLGDYVP